MPASARVSNMTIGCRPRRLDFRNGTGRLSSAHLTGLPSFSEYVTIEQRARGWKDGFLVPPGESREGRSTIMATVPKHRLTREVRYPTTDGKPMAETPVHIDALIHSIQVLQDRFADEPNVYVSGNMLLYYEEGNPRKHVAPDVLVALNLSKEPMRDYYLVWKEGKAPDFIVEITSKSTQRVDQVKKFAFYRDILRVSEYFMFDPRAEYLDPPLQGFRLIGGEYVRIEPIDGRLPSEVLGLHLAREGQSLRLFDPSSGMRLPTRLEAREAAEKRADEEQRRADEEQRRANASEAGRRNLAEENDRLRREIEALRNAQS
jgi:Uma2 family endonuclease